ncbi:MAG TPA: DUF748 domain-containing protein [Methylibium sp.]|nr:DUF748 domain-containing protein [Methylibium sp.]
MSRLPLPGALRGRLVKLAAVLAALALLWTAAVGWALPRLLQPRIEAAATEALGAPLVIDEIDIAPWSLQVSVLGLRLGPAEAPWLRVAEVTADVSAESLWRLAPVLERLVVRKPQVELERIDAQRFNVSPMLDALAKRPPAPPDAEPARFAVNNVQLEGGRIRFLDRVSGAEHLVEALHIGLPFVSNLPSHVAIDVEPLLDAVVNGSRLALRGKTRPFDEGLRSSIVVDWRRLDLPVWLAGVVPLLPRPVPVSLQQGLLDVALQIDFERRADPQPDVLRIGGTATLAQLQLVLPEQGLAVAFDQLAVTGLDLRPFERQARVGAVQLQGPVVELDLQAPPPPARGEAAPAEAPAAGGWTWSVGSVKLADGRVTLKHAAWPAGQTLTLASADIQGLDARPDAAPATLALQAADAQGARIRVDGTLGVAARQVALKADVQGLKPLPWLAPWEALLPVRLLDATVAVQAQAEAGATGWALKDGALQVDGLQLQPRAAKAGPRAGTDKLGLARLAVAGARLRGEPGQPIDAQVASVVLDGLDLQAARDERGGLAWLPPAADDKSTPAAPRSDDTPPPHWQLEELRCSGCSVALSDRGVKPAAQIAFTRIDLALRKLSGDLAQPIDFELAGLAGRTGKGGRLQLRGEVRPQPLALKSRIDIRSLDLSGLQPYLEPHVNLALASAKATAVGDLALDGSARQPLAAVRWKGRAALTELRTLDKLNDAELVRFKRLGLDAMEVHWKPDALVADLGQIALEDFYGRVIVNADGRINLRDIVKRGEEDRSLTTPTDAAAAPPAAEPPPADAAASAPEPAASASAGPGPQLRWAGIRLANGTVDFTDNFIRPNYSAKLTDIAGEISALAWNDPQPATVKVAGRVDGSAPLEIGGTMHPLGPRLATDITASARGIDITRLTAYSARYAGYGIEKGTLSVNVRYRIVDGKLEAENQLYLDQLTFGDKVDSPTALKLPILLAVSLLKDRNGVIDIHLPISGSLDDPKFSIGGIIVKVIVNLITKAITAPFSLLASAFGGGGEELGYVEFEPGSTVLSEVSSKRLDTLAKALLDRPALKLEATGRADAALDDAALRRLHLDRLMRAAKAKSSGDLPDSVTIEPAERARWLEAAYKAADLKAKPRNLIGLAKSLPPEQMEALLLESAPAGEEALRTLANQRGDRVKAYLTTRVPADRVLLTASKLGSEGITDKGRTTRVAFALK